MEMDSQVPTIPIRSESYVEPVDSYPESLSNAAMSNDSDTLSIHGEYVQIKDVSSDSHSAT